MLSIDQTESVSLEGLDSKDSVQSDWNGREVRKVDSEVTYNINRLFENLKIDLETKNDQLITARENLKSREFEVKKLKTKRDAREIDKNKAFGWNKKKLQKKFDKAECKLDRAKAARDEQNRLVHSLEKSVDVITVAIENCRVDVDDERAAFIKNLYSDLDIKDIPALEAKLSEIREDLKEYTDKLTIAQNLLIQKEAGLKEADKHLNEKLENYDKANRFKKAPKRKWKKVKKAERHYNRSIRSRNAAKNDVNVLKPKVDSLNEKFVYVEKELNKQKEEQARFSIQEELKKEVESLRAENEKLKAENSQIQIEGKAELESESIDDSSIIESSNREDTGDQGKDTNPNSD